MSNKKFFIETIMDSLQILEEIGGPVSYDDYEYILTKIREEIDSRLETASEERVAIWGDVVK